MGSRLKLDKNITDSLQIVKLLVHYSSLYLLRWGSPGSVGGKQSPEFYFPLCKFRVICFDAPILAA